jgi:hypothetical protein
MYSSAVETELFSNIEQIGTHEIWRGRCLLRINPVIMVGKDMRATSYVYWEINEGKRIPAGHYLRRTCEFKTCVNPEHRELIKKNAEESREEDRSQQLSTMQSIRSQLGAS